MCPARRENSSPSTIIADNVTGNTDGDGSPGIYSTGTFSVSDSHLTATGSEAAAREGLNSITLTNSDITGSKKWGVLIYQSTSGDAPVGMGTFDMTLSGTTTLSGSVVDDGGDLAIALEDSATWTAMDNSYATSLDGITFSGSTPTNVDSAYTIYYDSATNGSGTSLNSTYTLSSGGTLQKRS